MLVEGREPGRWALAHKTRHRVVDGVGSVDVAYLLLDAEPNPGERPVARCPAQVTPVWRGRVPRRTQPIVQAGRVGINAASAGLRAGLHPRDALARSRALAS